MKILDHYKIFKYKRWMVKLFIIKEIEKKIK